jgi:hypothetical protein
VDLLRARYQQANLAVLGLDVYNGNPSELSLFQASTSVTFPLLQKAVNGTVYGAWRDEIMLVDQGGSQRLILDIRRNPDWLERLTDEIDRLVNVPVARFDTEGLTLDSLRVGESVDRSLQITNDGKSPLTVSRPASDIDGVELDLPTSTVAPGESTTINLSYTPDTAGPVMGTISIQTPGAVSETISLDFDAFVLPPLLPKLSTLPERVELGSIETDRVGIYVLSVTNEGNADLVLSVNVMSEGVSGTGETRIEAGSSGTVRYRLVLDSAGTFLGTLVLDTNDPEQPSLSIAVAATGVVIPPDPRADLDTSGTVDFSDFLIFAGVFGTTDTIGDINANGVVDFGDFLILAQSFGKPISN